MSVEAWFAVVALALAVLCIGWRALLMPAEALDNSRECPDEVEAPDGPVNRRFDMNQCKPGDKLLSCHGEVFTYLGKDGPAEYPHRVRYPGSPAEGTRTDDGQVFAKNKQPEDHDIIGFAPGFDRSEDHVCVGELPY